MINHLVVHEIDKKQGKSTTIFKPSTREVLIDVQSENLLKDLHEEISKSSKKVYGKFFRVGDNYFKSILDRYLQNKAKKSFLEETVEYIGSDSENTLKSRISKVNLATGGHIVITDYTISKIRYFVVAMLNNKKGKAITIDAQGVPKFVTTEQIDFELMDTACRINITEYLNPKSQDNYLCFFSTREGISNYFSDFIGCEPFNQPRDNSRKLVKIIEAAVEGLENSEHLRSSAFDYCSKKMENKDPINLNQLSEHIFGTAKKDKLQETATLNNIKIDNSFFAINSELKRLVSFRYRGDWITAFRFERKNIDNIIPNEKENSVVLKNVPRLLKLIKDEQR